MSIKPRESECNEFNHLLMSAKIPTEMDRVCSHSVRV